MTHVLGLRIIVRARARTHNVRVVDRAGKRYRAGAARINVAEREAQLLNGVRRELVLVQQNRVMTRARRAVETSVRLQVEIEIRRVHDVRVNDCAGRAVATAVGAPVASREHTDMVTLADDDEGERRRDAEFAKGAYKNGSVHHGVSDM